MKSRKAVMDFVRFAIALLIEFANNVVAKMTANPDYLNPDIPLADITSAINKLNNAALNADGGGRIQHEVQRVAKDELIGLLKAQVDYVNRIAKHDVVKILSSGFHVSKEPLPRIYPEFWAEHGMNPGEVRVGCKAIQGARAYMWQYCYGSDYPAETGWILAGASTQRKMGLQNLDSGNTVWLRYCGITRYGMLPWSEPIKFLVV